MNYYPCYNGVILAATAAVFALVESVFMWHTDWNWYGTWYGVMLLNSTYFATLILLLHRLNPNAFERDSQSKCKFLRWSSKILSFGYRYRYRCRSCNTHGTRSWDSYNTQKVRDQADRSVILQTVLTVWFSLSSLSMPWPIEEIYDEDTITATTVKTFVILTASGEHCLTAKSELDLEANDWTTLTPGQYRR